MSDAPGLGTRMVVSALGGMGAATVCHPIDVLRIQMQLQKFNSTLGCAKHIVGGGGVGALYEGVTAAYLRQWTYGSCRLGMYSFALDYLTKAKAKGESVTFVEKMGMGCVSGGIGSFIGNPSELALVRMGGDSRLPVDERRNYKNVVDCIYRTAKEEGLPALWRGATPTIIRACLLSSSTLAVYSEAKARLPLYIPILKKTEVGTMFAGTLVSSLVANILVNPFDVVKSRIQSMKVIPGQAPPYSGMVDCFAKSLKKEGPWFIYRGFTPAYLKLAPYTTISFILTEKIMAAVTGKKAF